MDVEYLSQIVIIILGISQIIKIWRDIFISDKKVDSPQKDTSLPSRPSAQPLTRLFFALCIVLFLFGALSILYSTVNINLDKEKCLQGYDPSYYKIIKTCDEYANSRHQERISLGMLSIGISFVLSAVGLFIQKFRTATLPQFVSVILWLSLGVWLIVSNL